MMGSAAGAPASPVACPACSRAVCNNPAEAAARTGIVISVSGRSESPVTAASTPRNVQVPSRPSDPLVHVTAASDGLACNSAGVMAIIISAALSASMHSTDVATISDLSRRSRVAERAPDSSAATAAVQYRNVMTYSEDVPASSIPHLA